MLPQERLGLMLGVQGSIGVTLGYIGVTWELYRETGKENGNHYDGLYRVHLNPKTLNPGCRVLGLRLLGLL